MKNNTPLNQKFLGNGYLIEKNILSKNNQNLILDLLSNNLKKFEKQIGYKNINRESWKDSKFTSKLMKFKNKHKESFSFYYDTIQGSVLLRKIASDSKILNKVSKILKIPITSIAHCNIIARMDGPAENKYTYGWHQEGNYYPMNGKGNGLFAWIPLNKIINKIGPVHACRKSHNEGLLNPTVVKKPGTAVQRQIPNKYIKKYKNNVESLNMNAGDALFMSMKTFHRSGENLSNLFRLSLVARYHDTTKDDFRPFADLGKYRWHKITNKELNSQIT